MEKLVNESIVAHLKNATSSGNHNMASWKEVLPANRLSLLETATSYNDQGLPVDIDLLYTAFDSASPTPNSQAKGTRYV